MNQISQTWPVRARLAFATALALVLSVLAPLAASSAQAHDAGSADGHLLEESFTGTVSTEGRAWWSFPFEVSAPGLVKASLSWESDADLNLYMRDPAGNLVVQSKTSATPEQVSFEASASGTYRLYAEAARGTAEFTLAAALQQGTPRSYVGAVDAASRPWVSYGFAVGEPGLVTTSLAWTGTADLDTYLRAPDGALVEYSRTSAMPEQVSFEATQTGVYRVYAHAVQGAAAFTLTADVHGGPDRDYAGSVDAAGSNWVSHDFAVAEPGGLTASLAWAGDADLDLYLRGPDGKLLATSRTGARPEQLTVEATAPGKYRVYAHAVAGASDFTLSAAVQTGTDRTYLGSVDSARQQWSSYLFGVTDPGELAVALDWQGAADLNLYMRDPAGALVVARTTSSKPELFTYPATVAGDYRVYAEAAAGAAGFAMTVTRTALPNTAPVISNIADRASVEGDAVEVAVVAEDADGDALTYSAQGLPDGVTIDGTTGVIGGTVAAGAAAGSPYRVSVTVADDAGDEATTSFAWTVEAAAQPPAEPVLLYRVNAGGPALTGTDPTWSADTATTPSSYVNAAESGSKVYSTSGAVSLDPSVPAGTPAAVFQTERYDPNAANTTADDQEMRWSFPVEDGSYQVRLHLAEIYATADGVRSFDVEIEDGLVLDDYDIHADVGHDVGVTKSFTVDVLDGALDIDFLRVVENPNVKGIEILTAGPAAPALAFGRADVQLAAEEGTSTSTDLALSASEGEAEYTVSSDAEWLAVVPATGTTPASMAVTADAATLAPGTYTGTLTATADGFRSGTTTVTFTVTEPAPSGPSVAHRVNAGGPLVADSTLGWSEDQSVSGASGTAKNGTPSIYVNAAETTDKTYGAATAVTLDGSVPAGTPAQLFQTERFDPSTAPDMQWDFPVTNGDYEVRLYFAEIFDGASTVGARVLDVSVEGALVIDDLDVYAAVGADVGMMRSVTTTVADGNVDIDFGHVVENPNVKAIEIIAVGDGTTEILSASPSSVSFDDTAVGASSSRTVTLTNSGDEPIEISEQTTVTAGFGLQLHTPTNVPAGGTMTADVVFEPTSAGSKTGSVSITHSGVDSPLTIALSGTATEGSTDPDPDPEPVAFSTSTLGGETTSRPTSLQFGPDGRLYVAQQDGIVKAYTVERNGANDYDAVATETIDLVKKIPNHDDDGTPATGVTDRQVTGLLLAGTAETPVLYVSSSDPRIGAGGSGTDKNLDTNSGVISKLTRTSTGWSKVDIVRGLPRSEENHSVNGMQLDGDTLYVAVGGHTNQGAPSHNFAQTPEYALSAAIVEIDLATIGDTTYDIPTLKGTATPFGGQDGLNQAKIVAGGPVQVYSPGYRNAYDVVITEAGRMYTYDNGPNGGWGEVPVGEGPDGTCTNALNEPGKSYPDNLHHVTGKGYYGGHPNPTRGNKSNTFGGLSPITDANPVECDYRIPTQPEDGALDTINSSTNGLTEYTATNFGGAMTGDLLAAAFNGNVYRLGLSDAGDQVTAKTVLFSGFGSTPLDVTAQGDDGPFPGTVWTVTIGDGGIQVFEPSDFGDEPAPTCTGADDTTLDEDGDGFTNADEIDAGTDPCSAASKPVDADGDGISDGTDPDDDNDTRPDTSDPFALDPDDGMTTAIGQSYTWNNDAPEAGGILGLGFTGLMTNGNTDYAQLFDAGNMTAGGAAGVTTVDLVPAGDAYQTTNTQQYGFQFGVDPGTANGPYTAHTRVLAPFAGQAPKNYQAMGLFIGTGSQDDYVKLVATANGGKGGIQFVKEVAAKATSRPTAAVPMPGPGSVDLYLTVDPAAGTVQPSYSVDGGQPVQLGGPEPVPASWLDDTAALAVGLISTSFGSDTPFPATWDLIEVTSDDAPAPQLAFGSADTSLSVTEGGTDEATVSLATDGAATTYSATDDADWLTVTPTTGSTPADLTLSADSSGLAPGDYTATVTASADGSVDATHAVTLSVTTAPAGGELVTRLNAGGPAVTTGGKDWSADQYFVGGNVYSNTKIADIAGTDDDVLHLTERSAGTNLGSFAYAIPVPAAGTYTVNLHLAEIYFGATGGTTNGSAGQRVFSANLEGGAVELADYDLNAEVDPMTAVVKSYDVAVSDGVLDIGFTATVNQPKVSAIEVLTAGDASEPEPDPVSTASATVAIDSGTGIESSTYSNGSFKVTNTSPGAQTIDSLRIDLGTSLLPDMLFDPAGTAGDSVAKCFTAGSGGAETGLTAPSDPCTSPFSEARDGGYEVMDIAFTDFDPGETFTFSVDVDPTSMKGGPTSGGPGSVSGLELSGAVAAVSFSDGATHTGQTYRIPNSNGGSTALVAAGAPAAPSIAVVGVDPRLASVSDPAQTVRVSGPAGATVKLLRVEAELDLYDVPDGGYDLDPFEANTALVVAEQVVTVGAGGTVDVPVTLTRSGDEGAGLNHFVAVVSDQGRTGAVSDRVVLELEADAVTEPVATGAWTTLAPSSSPRQEVSYVQVGDAFYLAGGSTLHEAYDPATDSWSTLAPLPKSLDHIQGVAVGSKIYYVGGLSGWPNGDVATVYVYDTATDTFSNGAAMPTDRGRGAGGVVAHDGRIYYAGGLHDGVAVPWVDVYDPEADSWQSLADMPNARDHFQAVVLDGKLWAIGGRLQAINATIDAVDVYDLSAGTWSTASTALPTERGGFATVVLGREILVIGGEGDGNTYDEVEAYDVDTNTWRALAPMPTPRHGIQAVQCNGGVYIAAGGKTQGGGSPSTTHEAFFLNGVTACGSDETAGAFQGVGGSVVMEVESAPLAGDWTKETAKSGFTGTGYYAWRGANQYSSPGKGLLSYTFVADEAGTYDFRLRNRRDYDGRTVASDQENDVWVRMDGGDWVKVFSNAAFDSWNWTTKFDFGHGNQPNAAYELSAGEHRLEIAGRSANFKIDRIHLSTSTSPSTTAPESTRTGQ